MSAFLFVGGVRRIQDLHKNTRNVFRTSSALRSDFDFKKITTILSRGSKSETELSTVLGLDCV